MNRPKKRKKIATKELDSFPPDCNPFRHDGFRLGADINERFMIMYDDYTGKSDHIIVLEKTTGRRLRVTFKKEGDK